MTDVVGAGVGVGVGAGTGLAGAELPDGEGAGDVGLGLPGVGDAGIELVAVGETGAGLAAVEGAASRATVATTGDDEGVTLHLSASAVPCRPERVAAAT